MTTHTQQQDKLTLMAVGDVMIKREHPASIFDAVRDTLKQADLLIVDAPDYRWLMYEFGGNRVAQVIKRGRAVL